jgi:hypothetical protein
MDEGFVVDYLSPPGTALEETDLMVKEVERLVLPPHRKWPFAPDGRAQELFATQRTRGTSGAAEARNRRSRSAAQVIGDLRARVHDARLASGRVPASCCRTPSGIWRGPRPRSR